MMRRFGRLWPKGGGGFFGRQSPDDATAGGGGVTPGKYFIAGFFNAIRIPGYMDI
jgi:hypothetical protein